VAITRAYTAEDPKYFVGQVAGADTVLAADLPYSPDACNELTFVDYSREAGASAASEQPAATSAAKPWWKFWD
jgi:hypothetical protein